MWYKKHKCIMRMRRRHILYALSCVVVLIRAAGCFPTPPMAETLNGNLNGTEVGINSYYTTDPNTAIRWNMGFDGYKRLNNEDSIIQNYKVWHIEPSGSNPRILLEKGTHFDLDYYFSWRRAGFTQGEAEAWQRAGFDIEDLSEILCWKREGFSPERAKNLKVRGIHCSIRDDE